MAEEKKSKEFWRSVSLSSRIMFEMLKLILADVYTENRFFEQCGFGIIQIDEDHWVGALKKVDSTAVGGYRIQTVPLSTGLRGLPGNLISAFAYEKDNRAVGVLCDDDKITLIVKDGDIYRLSNWGKKSA